MTNLTAADFRIRIDGRQAAIVTFSAEPQAFAAVLMVDFSASMSARRPAFREATEAFIDKLLPDDRVRLGGFSNRIALTPAVFSGDRAHLLDALRFQVGAVDAGGASPVWRAAIESLDALGGQPLRRVLILLSDGHDAPARGQGGIDAEDVVRRARADATAVYTIGVVDRRRGLSAYEPVRVTGPSPRLAAVADRTGGRHVEIERAADFAAALTTIVDELHSQYLIGVAVEDRDGRRHDLDVSVRQEQMKVRAPGSFVARR